MRVKTWFRTVVLMLAVVGWGGLAVGQSHDYVFTIDQARSNLTFLISTSIGKNDSDSSAVVGTMGVTLTPSSGVFTNIHITDVTADLVKTHLEFDFYILWYHYTVDVYNAGLRMGGGYGQAGSAVTVSGGNFNQTGNLVKGVGQLEYNFGTLGSGSMDLSAQDPGSTDFAGTVVDDGQTITLTIPIHLVYEDVGDMGLADAYIDGQIVATVPTDILTCKEQGKYYPADINEDCYVDIQDLALFMQNWLDCNDPDNQVCF